MFTVIPRLPIEVLDDHGGALRFSELRDAIGGISQKMLTKTLRELERGGLVTRRVFAEVPPRVEYELTKLGESLGEAVCGILDMGRSEHRRRRAGASIVRRDHYSARCTAS